MRYNRQEIFKKLKGKQSILNKITITIIGLGALGTVSSEILARAGINLKLIDRDIIDITNLQRQSLYTEKDLGELKAITAEKKLREINSEIKITAYVENIDYKNIEIIKSDLILDCTDNMETRFLINEYCKENKIPWIYGGAIGSRGMVMNILLNGPCFQCVFKEPNASLGTCDTEGIINTIPSVIGGIQANEAIKILTKQNPSKNLITFDIWTNSFNKIKIKKRNCEVCRGKYEYLNGKTIKTIKLCGRDTYMIKGNFNLKELSSRFKGDQYHLKDDKFIIFKDRVIIKAKSQNEAKALFDRHLK